MFGFKSTYKNIIMEGAVLIKKGVITSVGGLIGFAILFGVLQIGNDNKGWTLLE